MILSSTATPENFQAVSSTISVSVSSPLRTRNVLLLLGWLPLYFLTTPDFFDQVSEEISWRVPWAETTHSKGNNKMVRELVFCPHLRWFWERQDSKAGLYTKVRVKNLMSFERKPLQSSPSLSLFRTVRLVSLTFLSHFCFVCEMSGRVWLVFQTITHVLHPAHVWGSHARTPPNSEKEGPQSEAEHRQKHHHHRS